MQALEMEEVESLVGSSRKKINQARKSIPSNGDSLVASVANRGFIVKVLVVAGLAMVLLVAMSASDPKASSTKPGVNKHPGGDHVETKAPHAVTEPPTVEVVKLTSTEAPSPAAQSSPVTDPPEPSPTLPPEPAGGGDNQNGNGDAGENVYSKYATIVPIPGIELLDADNEKRQQMVEDWGKWSFWDGDEDLRPPGGYTLPYPNNDMPASEFPQDAWQEDAVFVNHYLDAAEKLISRAMEAIYSEYGWGKPLSTDRMIERMKMFRWERVDLATQTQPPAKFAKGGNRGNGGWTTERSFDGLVRRLLHAMMTQDTFTVVMGGHSAAVGQGNHFRQSYMMQFHKVLYPIFARLGVKLITRNMAQGGMGTVHNAMASGSIYGNADLILWDSGMTENSNPEHIDLFMRQALLGGDRVPVIWGGDFQLLRMLHEEADVDVGEFGNGKDGILPVTSAEQANQIPWAARYLACADNVKALCNTEPRFCAKCWIERSDGIAPTANQLGHPRGQVKWHPGWRVHQLQGRVLAFAILDALAAAVNRFSEGTMGGPPLDESEWHVTEYYENIRNKVRNLDRNLGKCHKIEGTLPTRMCTTAMKGATQYTPRANPGLTSLTSIIKPTDDGYVPTNKRKPLYEGQDEHNECFDIPDGEIDVYQIIAARRRLAGEVKDPSLQSIIPPSDNKRATSDGIGSTTTSRFLEDAIVPGKGWEVWGEPSGTCDGTYEATCALDGDNECTLYGHHDARGDIIGNEYSGWLVMNLAGVKEGVIVIKLQTWHTPNESTVTAGWTSVNGVDKAARRLGGPSGDVIETEFLQERTLMRSYDTPTLPDDFIFEYAINGSITSLSKDDFLSEKKTIQRVVETITLLDDSTFTSDPIDVEVAIRMRNCGRTCTFGLSHIYWA